MPTDRKTAPEAGATGRGDDNRPLVKPGFLLLLLPFLILVLVVAVGVLGGVTLGVAAPLLAAVFAVAVLIWYLNRRRRAT